MLHDQTMAILLVLIVVVHPANIGISDLGCNRDFSARKNLEVMKYLDRAWFARYSIRRVVNHTGRSLADFFAEYVAQSVPPGKKDPQTNREGKSEKNTSIFKKVLPLKCPTV